MSYASPVSEGEKHYVLRFRHGDTVRRVHVYRHTSLEGVKKNAASVHVHNLSTFRRIFEAMPAEDRTIKNLYARKYQRYWDRTEELCKRYSRVLAGYHGHLEERSQQERDVVYKIAHEVKHVTQNLGILRRKARKMRPLNCSDNIAAASAMADTQRCLEMMKRNLDFLDSFNDIEAC